MACGYIEDQFTFEDYIIDRNQKESKEKGSKSTTTGSTSVNVDGSGEEDSEMDDEEEEDAAALNWNRAEAERMYGETRTTLQEIYYQHEQAKEAM